MYPFLFINPLAQQDIINRSRALIDDIDSETFEIDEALDKLYELEDYSARELDRLIQKLNSSKDSLHDNLEAISIVKEDMTQAEEVFVREKAIRNAIEILSRQGYEGLEKYVKLCLWQSETEGLADLVDISNEELLKSFDKLQGVKSAASMASDMAVDDLIRLSLSNEIVLGSDRGYRQDIFVPNSAEEEKRIASERIRFVEENEEWFHRLEKKIKDEALGRYLDKEEPGPSAESEEIPSRKSCKIR